MMRTLPLSIPQEGVAEFCQRHHIRRLALFGSVLSDRFGPDSDIDVLVEFEPQHTPGFIRLSGMELELTELLGQQKVDMRTAQDLSRHFRDQVLAAAETIYEG